MQITLAFKREWDAVAWKTRAIHPTGAPAFLLTWRADPCPVEGGIPAPLIPPLARALGVLGPVVFYLRWPPDPPAPSLRMVSSPARTLRQTIVDLISHRASPALAVASDAAGAAVFLDQGWAYESQLGFLLSPGAIRDPTLLTRLFRGPAWHDFIFPSSVQALIAPPNDGDGVFVSTARESIITRIMAEFTEHLTAAGFRVEPPEDHTAETCRP